MTRFVYFAYGSNMLTERLNARCPSADVMGPAEARGFSVSYCLHSTDESAKAGLQRVETETAWGVLFSLDISEREVLDGFEGAPLIYTREEIAVHRPDGTTLDAVTYIPHEDRIVADGRPYAWYRALCVGGARQHDLPELATQRLMQVEVLDMPAPGAPAWRGRSQALDALKRAGLSMREGL